MIQGNTDIALQLSLSTQKVQTLLYVDKVVRNFHAVSILLRCIQFLLI